MLEIKTVVAQTEEYFDDTVNAALAEGWELVRRECFITGSDRVTTFYAELERITEEPEQDSSHYAAAHWIVTRNPLKPYRCSECGSNTNEPWSICPTCEAAMLQGDAE